MVSPDLNCKKLYSVSLFLLILLSFSGVSFAEENFAINFNKIITETISKIANQKWSVSPVVSGVKPNVSSSWSGAALTSNVDAGGTTGFGIGLGLEKPNYQVNSTLRNTSWTNASFTSFMIDYDKPFELSRLVSFPLASYLNDIQLIPGAGAGLGYFSNDLTNESTFGLLFDVHAGVNKNINKKWAVFSNLTFQYANLETSKTNALNNTHRVTLKNVSFIELGVKYRFGARQKSKPVELEEQFVEEPVEKIEKLPEQFPELVPEHRHEKIIEKPLVVEPEPVIPTKIPTVVLPIAPVVLPPVIPVIAPLPAPVIVSDNINGYVTDSVTGKLLENVKVKVFLNEQDIVSYTDEKGHYILPVKLTHLPGSFAMAFSLKGYVPVSKNITKKKSSGFVMNTTLEEESINTVVLELEPNLHHLGDGNFKGAANSQFQVAVEGKTFEIGFNILAEHLTAKTGEITLQVKGLNHENKLMLNNKFVASMNASPTDGSFGDLSYKFDTSGLIEGKNTISITSVIKGSSPDHDDFEFTNVILRLTY